MSVPKLRVKPRSPPSCAPCCVHRMAQPLMALLCLPTEHCSAASPPRSSSSLELHCSIRAFLLGSLYLITEKTFLYQMTLQPHVAQHRRTNTGFRCRLVSSNSPGDIQRQTHQMAGQEPPQRTGVTGVMLGPLSRLAHTTPSRTVSPPPLSNISLPAKWDLVLAG